MTQKSKNESTTIIDNCYTLDEVNNILSEVHRTHGKALIAIISKICYNFGLNPTMGQDIYQHVCWKLLEPGIYPWPRSNYPPHRFIIRKARFRIFDILRETKRETNAVNMYLQVEAGNSHFPSPEVSYMRKERVSKFFDSLGEDDESRDIAFMYYGLGLKKQEIATELGLSLKYIQSRMKYIQRQR